MTEPGEIQLGAIAADLLIESPKHANQTAISHLSNTSNNSMDFRTAEEEEEEKYYPPMHSPSSKKVTSMNMPSLHLTDENYNFEQNKARASFSHSASKSRSHSSITMTSYRRKSFVYRAPTVTSQKDIRTVCFYLAIHGIVIGFVGWCINILISLLYANQCQLFDLNGSVQLNTFLYCTLINNQMIQTCSSHGDHSSHNNNYVTSFFIIGCITALVPNLFGTLFGFLWKSKVPDLSALSSRQRSMSRFLMIYRSINVNIRKIIAWLSILLILLLCLVGEYFVDETHFIRHVKGGRYTYCLVVIFTGLFIFKCIQLITDWEFKAYIKKKKKKRNEAGTDIISSPETATDDKSKWDEMLSGVQETEPELIISKKRTALFHRDLTTFMLNTTIGVLLPALKMMPAPWSGSIDAEDMEKYTAVLMACIGEATMFIWSACITSQTMALSIELSMKWIYNKLEKEYIPDINLKSANARNRKDKLILFLFTKIGAKHVHGLYVTHENWFILLVLFLWQCQWGWLNPNMFVMGAGTMLYITIVYKIRFTVLKPRIEKQFIAHLVREECFLYMIYLFIPLQFIILLPFHTISSPKNVKCNVIIFGLPSVTFLITVLNGMIYRVCLRKNRTPYLVAITEQWNNIENKLHDTRGIKSVAK